MLKTVSGEQAATASLLFLGVEGLGSDPELADGQ